METQTIKTIKEYCDQISNNLEVYQNSITEKEENLLYGTENEYSVKGVVAGIQNILTDISYLVENPEQFVKISACAERDDIKRCLNNLNNCLRSKNISNVATCLDTLKVKIRFYHPRADKGRLIEFEKEIDDIRRLGNDLKKDINKVGSKLKAAQRSYDNIVEVENKYNGSLENLKEKSQQLEEKLGELKNKYSDLTVLAGKAEKNEAAISEHLNEANSSKEEFDNFINKISDREKELVRQSAATAKYEEQLGKYKVDYDEKMETVAKLIDEAKRALNYKNAEGLSAAFSLQLDKAMSKANRGWWIAGAIIFVVITLIIGVWLVLGWGLDNTSSYNVNKMVFSIVGRLSMITLTITAAIFCANQYTKQKNIIEDYAYKTVISKSIIAFSEELRAKDPERYAEYISTILKELYQDPLRKHSKNEEEISIKESGLIDKFTALVQAIK